MNVEYLLILPQAFIHLECIRLSWLEKIDVLLGGGRMLSASFWRYWKLQSTLSPLPPPAPPLVNLDKRHKSTDRTWSLYFISYVISNIKRNSTDIIIISSIVARKLFIYYIIRFFNIKNEELRCRLEIIWGHVKFIKTYWTVATNDENSA